MAFYDRESDIFALIQRVPDNKIACLTGNASEETLIEIIRNTDHWIDNSEDTNYPPDYLNDIDHIMMDFMRTNDYEKRSKSGKVRNDIAAAENKAIRELKNCIPEGVAKNIDIYAIPDVEPQPNFERYYYNMQHVLESHGKQIPKYKEYHPSKDIVFCVCDLSEHDHLLTDNAGNTCGIFLPCYDQRVLKIIKECGADYVIWVKPYLLPDREAPQMVVIDTKKLHPDIYPIFRGFGY